MAAVDFAKSRQQAEDQGLVGGGDYLKLKEGDNRMRLLSECLPHVGEFQGQRNFKWLCYVIDRRDGKPKPFFMPHRVYKAIEALQVNPDYTFEEVPMPYDVTVTAEGAGTREVKYGLIPARKETAISAVEFQEIAKLKPLAELQIALKEKNAKASKATSAIPGVDEPPPPSDEDYPFMR